MAAVAAPTSSIYNTASPPQDYVATDASHNGAKTAAKDPKGVDMPVGTVLANVAAPLMLYTQLKGKSDLWDRLLSSVPDSLLREPTLDVGCGRGLVLLKMAEKKKALGVSEPAAKSYAIAMSEPAVPAANAAELDVTQYAAVHQGHWAMPLPFADASFGLVTASLSLHLASAEQREAMMKEMIRVCRPGGQLIVVDLMGYCGNLKDLLVAAGWPEKDIEVVWSGPGIMYGMWPAHTLTAKCPQKA